MIAFYSYRLCEVEQQGPVWEEELLEVVTLLGRRRTAAGGVAVTTDH